MRTNKFGCIEINIDKSPDLKSGTDPYLLSIITKENIKYDKCSKCMRLHNKKYESCSLLDIKRIPKKEISKAEFVVLIRDALRDGYCVLWEYDKFGRKYKSIVFAIYTSLIHSFCCNNNRNGMGYNIKFDVIGINYYDVYETRNINEDDLFNEYRAIENGEVIMIKTKPD